jgi:hypothetical protein
VEKLTLSVSGDAEIIPDDLGYISYLAGAVGNSDGLNSLTVRVSGKMTFGEGKTGGIYEGKTIADEINEVVGGGGSVGEISLEAGGGIVLPVGSDKDTFFGESNKVTVDEGSVSVADDETTSTGQIAQDSEALESLIADGAKELAVTVVEDGEALKVEVGMDYVGATVSPYIYSAPVVATCEGGCVVDADGYITVKLPAGLGAGAHVLAVYDSSNTLIGYARVELTADADGTIRIKAPLTGGFTREDDGAGASVWAAGVVVSVLGAAGYAMRKRVLKALKA